jgi:hypothetical protein
MGLPSRFIGRLPRMIAAVSGGAERFTVAFLLNLLIERAMIVGRILNTGLIKARITEGPLCGRSAIVLFQYTMPYLGLRPPSHAGNARPRARMTRV